MQRAYHSETVIRCQRVTLSSANEGLDGSAGGGDWDLYTVTVSSTLASLEAENLRDDYEFTLLLG